jgi:NitT/TauT family transport system substrate-binding protein
MIRPTLRSRVVRIIAPLMASALALSLSACGSSDDESAGKGGLTKIRVATAGMIPAYEDLVWGIEGGFFKDHGLDVEMTPPLYAADALNAVMNGDAEMSITTATLVASARAAGRPLKVIATHQGPFPLEIVFTAEADKKLRDQGLSETSDIGDFFEALEGLTLGTSPVGSSINSTFRFLLSEQGIDPEKDNLTLQAMPDIAAQVAALSNNKVAGLVSALGGASTGAAAQGIGTIWRLDGMSGNDSLNALPYCNMVTSESLIKKDPEAIQSFLDALHEAQQSLIDGIPAEDVTALKELLGSEMDQKVYDDTTARERTLFQDDFTTSDEAWDVVLKVAQVTSDAPLEVAADDAIDNSFAEKVK